MSKKLTIELSDEQAAFAEAKVAAGEYASLDEAVAAGISNLQERDAMIDRWMRDEVIPTYDQWIANGKPVLTEEEVYASVEAAIEDAAKRKAS